MKEFLRFLLFALAEAMQNAFFKKTYFSLSGGLRTTSEIYTSMLDTMAAITVLNFVASVVMPAMVNFALTVQARFPPGRVKMAKILRQHDLQPDRERCEWQQQNYWMQQWEYSWLG